MGLDLVEFAMAVEEKFQISISDEDAAKIATPRELTDYLYARVGDGAPSRNVQHPGVRG